MVLGPEDTAVSNAHKVSVLVYLQWASLVAQVVKKSTCNTGDADSVPGSGRSPGEGNSNPLQYSCLENSTGCTVHGIAKSLT